MQDSQQSKSGGVRRETSLERLDRNLEELTGELRVVVTGVQVLFAFLLILPFNSGFAHVGSFEQTVYIVTLILAALAAVCTIAPSAQHRFLLLATTKLYGIPTGVLIASAGMLPFAVLWFAIPLRRRQLLNASQRGSGHSGL